MRVKFKSKEVYETYKRNYAINGQFCELIKFDDEFEVPSLDDDISVEDVTISGDRLWDLDHDFFNFRYNTLFRYSDEIELLEEVKNTDLKVKFDIELKGSYTKEELILIAKQIQDLVK